ncbi:LppA family lipoprotein [Mycobacterium shigaense]|uniref:LppA family lipoprotein n=1 Tax=Mycobacterium shigaense TaxID=722731 RepID=UPI000E5765E0|nr:LppA family lipoprotein [Mycobacterium shigaense]MEA1120707.1 LppA family lipoprotein [Mycobacterium shigaense]
MRCKGFRWFAAALVIAMAASGCAKPTTFDPHANPGRAELDRLQKMVNDRSDLEIVEQQLTGLDATIRATIAKYSPATTFTTTPMSNATNGCNDPFNRSIGRQVGSDRFEGRPAPSPGQWLQITSELAPVFSAAGFHSNGMVVGQPPPPLGGDDDSQIRDDGALIHLGTNPLVLYDYNTGCHLPAAWRTAPPPLDMRPSNDPDIHYPYLYGPPGGRNVDAH